MKKIIYFLLILCLFNGTVHAGGKGAPKPAPRYYTFEDLKTAIDTYKYTFSFYNYYKPYDALATLPSKPADSDSTFVTSAKVARLKANGWWYSFLDFPWYDSNIREGDVVFLRCADAASSIIRRMSSWTHTAMIYNKGGEESFESQKSNGVNIYNYKTAWVKIVAYSVKRVKIANPLEAVKAAAKSYAKKIPYIPPSVSQNDTDMVGLIKKWSNKWDTSSMYCSKLVWWTFKKWVDLDSNRTSTLLDGCWQPSYTDVGMHNWNSWIGVSPDDIYYSKYMGSDIRIAGESNLSVSLSDSIF